MSRDSYMEVLKCEITGLSAGNPDTIKIVFRDFGAWLKFACKTLSRHGLQLEIQVFPGIIAQAFIAHDLHELRLDFSDTIYGRHGFTEAGTNLLAQLRHAIEQTIERYTEQDLLVKTCNKPLTLVAKEN